MTIESEPRHVYAREMSAGDKSSLAALAELIPAGSTVLDVGCGSGALGRYLQSQQGCLIDGLTISDEEACLARGSYRTVVVADLETLDLAVQFDRCAYDVIVCADVLEHLKHPERTLAACKQLLKPQGRLLLSVPNVGYCGLIAELIQGQFRYRQEGLLDATHMRFFTRDSLLEFLAQNDWHAQSVVPIRRELHESEFKAPFDRLSPAVARYLLAMPDALSYQFVVTALSQPSQDSGLPLVHASPLRAVSGQFAQAHFSAQLFWAVDHAYDESRKLVLPGIIGQPRQTLEFRLPASGANVTALRLDPADRPGFLHLHAIVLRDNSGQTVWDWRPDADGIAALLCAPQQQLLISPLSVEGAPLTLTLLGEDPWLELPIPPALLNAGVSLAGGTLAIELGWPMSADAHSLLAVSNTLGSDEGRLLKASVKQLQHKVHDLTMQLAFEQQALALAGEREGQLHTELGRLRLDRRALQSELKANQLATAQLSEIHQGLIRHLRWIENSTVFRLTRPLVHFKMRVDRLLQLKDSVSARLEATPEGEVTAIAAGAAELAMSPTVDVIVPVYKGLADTQRCIQSALQAPVHTDMRLVVINDASPEPEVTQWLRELAINEPRVMLLENPTNLGFVATVNRGMALSRTNDVLLLNSDTEVANDWLDRIRTAAYSAPRAGTVTPFSNNATICSYPRFCEPNPLPAGMDTAAVDALFACTHPKAVVDIPTAVGFCMYIRRDCLDEVGFFDVDNFGKGYGEENDFCCRATARGWRHLHALDVFVLHAGGVSFGDSKSARELAAMETLRRIHPGYEPAVHDFVARDPAQPFRVAAQMAQLRACGKPVVLTVLHDRAGGTLRHAHELEEHLQAQVAFCTLTPIPGGVTLAISGAGESGTEGGGPDRRAQQTFAFPSEWPLLVDTLKWLGVGHIHYHHLLGHDRTMMSLPSELGVSYDFTAHDYHVMCPQISLTDHTNRYCGELGVDQCRRCLQRSPAPGGVDIDTWRESHRQFVEAARNVLAPSWDAKRRFERYFPAARVRLAPHTDLLEGGLLDPVPVPALPPTAPLKVVVIGALSTIKGADLLEDVALASARVGAPLEFHLLGYGYRHLRTQPKAALTVHGAYEERDLASLLDWLRPHAIWFPAQWPETYSYTLSASLRSRLPIVAPDLGAFPSRLDRRPWTWVRPWQSSAEDWISFFLNIRKDHFVTGVSPAVSLTMPVVEIRSGTSDWCYRTDYATGLTPPKLFAAVPPKLLAREQQSAAGHGSVSAHTTKKHLLNLVLKLRAAPLMGPLARRVPLRWQTRLKTWLRA